MLNQADCLEKIRALVYESSVKPYEPTKEDLDKLRLRLVCENGLECNYHFFSEYVIFSELYSV